MRLTDAQSAKLDKRTRMARESVEDAAGTGVSPLEELALVLELRLLRFRIWRLQLPGLIRYPKGRER